MIIVNTVSSIAGGYKCERMIRPPTGNERKRCKHTAANRINMVVGDQGPADYLLCAECTEELLGSRNTKQ